MLQTYFIPFFLSSKVVHSVAFCSQKQSLFTHVNLLALYLTVHEIYKLLLYNLLERINLNFRVLSVCTIIFNFECLGSKYISK